MWKWNSGRVKRWHNCPIIGEQNVADHSWGTAQILLYLWPDSRKETVYAALDHDVLELITGDMPHTTKTLFPAVHSALKDAEELLTKLNSLEYFLTKKGIIHLRIADMAEALVFAKHQTLLGNSFMERVVTVASEFLFSYGAENLPDECHAKLCDLIYQIKTGEFFNELPRTSKSDS